MEALDEIDEGLLRQNLRYTTEGLLDDVGELQRHLKVTSLEREWAQSRLQLQIATFSGLTRREAAVHLLETSAALALRCLAEVDSEPPVVLLFYLITGQGLLTKVLGNCLGLQLSMRADQKLELIKAGASTGGIKGAATRRLSAIDPTKVVRRARACGWPNPGKGLNKLLSREFDCSADHFGRILRAAKSDR